MSVLVTGGAGYIGSVTVAALQERGEAVVVLDDLSAGHAEALPDGVPLYRGDIADEALLRSITEEHDVQDLVHFAALRSVPESVTRPDLYFANNSVKTLQLLDVLRSCGLRTCVFSSTAAVYGEPERIPIAEGHPLRPTNPYGRSKHFVEGVLEAYDRAFGLGSVALRYFNAAGGTAQRGEDHRPEGHLIPLVLQVALGQRERICVFGDDYDTPDGTCVRDYIHVEDLADAHLRALDHLRSGGASAACNLGNGEGYSVRQVIDVARAVTGHPIPERCAPRRAGDPATLIASAQRARELLGWVPRKPSLEEIVASAWEWHGAHPAGYADGGERGDPETLRQR